MNFDVVIIGGGFSGIAAALTLARISQKMHCFLSRDSQNPMAVLQESRHQLLQYPSVTWLRGTAWKFSETDSEVEVSFCQDCADGLDGEPADGNGLTDMKIPDGHGFKEKKARGRFLIFATGMKDNLPSVEGFGDIYSVTAHHCPFCDGYEHQGARMAVYGKGEKASGLALELLLWSQDIVVCLDGGDESEIPKEHRQKLDEYNIRVIADPIARLESTNQKLENIVFASGWSLPRDVFWFNTGKHQHSELACSSHTDCHASTNHKGKLKTNHSPDTGQMQQKQHERLFAVGNCADDSLDLVAAVASAGLKCGVAVTKLLLKEKLGLKQL